MNRLQNKVVLITGASSGIGRAAALRFAQEGARVVCADLRRELLPNGFESVQTPTDELIRENGGQAIFVPCDISDEKAVEAAFAAAVDAFGRLDVLVCNAGIYYVGQMIHETPREILERTIDVNIKGTWFCCQNAVRQFLKQHSKGTIVINASSSAVNPYPVQAV